MQGIPVAFPSLVSGEAITCVRFLLEWTDARLHTSAGRVHHFLTSFHNNSEPQERNGEKNEPKQQQQQQEGLSMHTFHMRQLPAMVHWLTLPLPSHTTTTTTTTTSTHINNASTSLLHNAVRHVMRDGHAGNARNHQAASARAQATAEKLLAAARSTQYRAPLVLLLFHPNEAVRMWARETLLRLVTLAAAAATTTSNNAATGNENAARSLWLLSMQLLCTIKHITRIPLEAKEEGARRVIADGFCSLFAVLSTIDTQLAAVERVLLEAAAAHGEQHPRLFHGVSTATILLLGGSMLFDWFLSVSTTVSRLLVSSSPSAEHTFSTTKTRTTSTTTTTAATMAMIEKLTVALNLRLGAETTLQSLTIANDTRRALVKIIVHCLLDNAKRIGMTSKAEDVCCRRRMCELYCLASHIDPPPSTPTRTTTTTTTISTSTGRIGESKSSPPPAKSAGWMLRFLMRNASVQLNIPAAVRGITGGGTSNASTLHTMENAVSVLNAILTSLATALPALASSVYYHEFLRTQQKDCVALAIGVALNSQHPQAALSLLRHFLLTDLVIFGSNPSSTLPECLRSAWEAIPELLVKISFRTVSTSINSPPMLLLNVMELFDVIMAQPSANGWLFLKPLKDGPLPLAWVVGKCIERVTESIRGSMKEMRHQWETMPENNNNNHNNNSAAAAASRLLSSGSTIPRVTHVLMMSSGAVVRRLGEILSALFLHSFTPVVHGTLRADAANWLLDVILYDSILRENPLKLQNAKVDSLARANGAMWVNIMCGCNWSNLPRETLAASWWLCALIADVCVLDNELRNQFLDLVITQLQPVFTETPSSSTALTTTTGTISSSASSSSSSSSSSLSASTGNISSNVVSHNHSSAFLAQEPLRRCAQHLMLVLVKKCSLYSVSSFTQAVLHVAGALPPPTRSSQDQSFRSALLKTFVDVLQILPVEGRNTLMEYPPAWLLEILRSARQKIEDCVADQNRRFQQYELEEKRMKQMEEGDRKRSEQEAEMCRANIETRKQELIHQQQQQQSEETSSLLSIGRINNGVKRPHEDMTPIMIAQIPPVELISSSSSTTTVAAAVGAVSSRIREQQKVRLEPPVLQKQPTAHQMHLHQLGERRVNAFIHAENLNKSTEAIRQVAGSTDLLHHSPRTDDIIGHGRNCLATELPVIPQRFPSLTSGGHKQYVASFLPHIALELRYELHQKFDEMVEACRTHTLRSTRNNDNQTTLSSLRHRVTGASNNPNNNNNSGYNRLSSLSTSTPTWVMANTTAVVSAGDVVTNTLNPTQLQFGILAKSLNAAAIGVPLSASLSEGDVAIVLLPLNRVLTALPHLLDGKDDTALPEVWRVFGCVPQLCIVTFLQPWQRTATLTTFTTPSISSSSYTNTNTGRGNNNSNSGTSSSGPMLFTFSHALRALIDSREHFYIRRLTTLGSSLGAVTAIHEMHRKAFANTLLQPHIASKMFRAYHRVLERELLTGERWPTVYRSLLLNRSLNEWQMRAIAAVLTAAAPGWEKSNVQMTNFPQAPDLFIIEGPPGTGKTQTIAALLINLLHYLPKQGRRLLVCAPSNCAVDEVLLRVRSLLNKVPQMGELQLLRVGVRESVDAEVLAASPPIFLDDCISMLSDASSVSRSVPTGLLVRNGNRDESTTTTTTSTGSGNNSSSSNSNSNNNSGRQQLRDQLLRGAHVVCSTLGSLTQIQRIDTLFDMVIVDEASQGSEPDVLQALMLTKRRVVLVGDSKQLQPTVLCQTAAGRGLKRSLLQRLLHEGYRSYLLRTQYRMHPDICAFPNNYFYDGKLHTHASVLQRPYGTTPPLLRLPVNSSCLSRFVFVDVPDGRMEWGRGRSLVNRREAEAIVMQMRRLRALLQLTPDQFAQHACVITFYQAQRDAIVQLLTREERSSELMVATVDSFQGKERDVVFISCVRAPHIAHRKPNNNAVTLGFMEDWHRINVALTRAKELCVVFGHQQTFRNAALTSANRQQQQQQQKGEEEEEEEEEELQEFLPTGEENSNQHDANENNNNNNNNNNSNNNNSDDDDDDDDEVCEVAPSVRKSDDDPFVLDRLIQHVECFSKKEAIEQQQQEQQTPDACVSAAIFTNSNGLHLAKELFLRP
ncbi:putative nonsense mRNA reducing factor 1 [Trypanosoma theileri]|uniref:Putative nonsense mRNA reducing factor 1 n=1 Tax=Trypanosoma theileri TaxID=67003 RepID=A0A1X0NHV3_9TRYP|nr:putative nonsense mRNA reducing factor 1 [Trypanosoma theileri]ORC84315.1 putative nonsense mRNA reducing factor 1 [Trypanosoma theileri]